MKNLPISILILLYSINLSFSQTQINSDIHFVINSPINTAQGIYFNGIGPSGKGVFFMDDNEVPNLLVPNGEIQFEYNDALYVIIREDHELVRVNLIDNSVLSVFSNPNIFILSRKIIQFDDKFYFVGYDIANLNHYIMSLDTNGILLPYGMNELFSGPIQNTIRIHENGGILYISTNTISPFQLYHYNYTPNGGAVMSITSSTYNDTAPPIDFGIQEVNINGEIFSINPDGQLISNLSQLELTCFQYITEGGDNLIPTILGERNGVIYLVIGNNFGSSNGIYKYPEDIGNGLCQMSCSNDATPPTCITQDITILADINGSITPQMIDNGSFDDCNEINLEINADFFNCDDKGEHVITLFVTDSSNNQSSCTAIVTVECGDEYMCPDTCRTTIVDLSTGVDFNTGDLLPLGAYEGGWQMISGPDTDVSYPRPGYVLTPDGAWDNLTGAQYISPFPNASNNDQFAIPYLFERCFCVCEDDTQVNLDVATLFDNFINISLYDSDGNLIEQLIDYPGPANFTTFSLPPDDNTFSAPLNAGEYCLQVGLRNDGGVSLGMAINATLTGASLIESKCCSPFTIITGTVFQDETCNSLNDRNVDGGLQGVEVILCNAAGDQVYSVMTDVFGYYSFMDIEPGNYTVKQSPLSNFDLSLGSDGYKIEVTPNTVDGDIDFGNCQPDCNTVLNFNANNEIVLFEGVGADSDFTIGCWFKADSANNGGPEDRIFAFGPTDRLELGIDQNGNLWRYDQNKPNPGPVSHSNYLIRDNQWHHIAFVANGSSRTLYLDFEEIETYVANNINYGPDLTLGNWAGSLSQNAYFTGNMDDFKAYSQAFSTIELCETFKKDRFSTNDMLQIYLDFEDGVADEDNTSLIELSNQGILFNPKLLNFVLKGTSSNFVCDEYDFVSCPDECDFDTDAPLVACPINIAYVFSLTDGVYSPSLSDFDIDVTDDCKVFFEFSPSQFNCSNLGENTITVTVTDVAGNSAACTINFTLVDSDNNCTQSECPNSVIIFDRNSDQLIANSSLTSNADFTIEFWFNLNANPPGTTFTKPFKWEDSNGSSVFTISEINGSFRLIDHYFNNSQQYIIPFSGTNVRDGEWHHCAVTKNNDLITVYLDALSYSYTTNITSTWDIPSQFRLGRTSESVSQSLDGQMDEFRLWSSAKTQAEINSQKSIELVGTESNLEVYYHFGQGVPDGDNTCFDVIFDQSPNGNDASFVSFSKTGMNSNIISSDLEIFVISNYCNEYCEEYCINNCDDCANDNIPPVVNCESLSIEVNLDANGQVQITENSWNIIASDECGDVIIPSIDFIADCSKIGQNLNYPIQITDEAGNSSSCGLWALITDTNGVCGCTNDTTPPNCVFPGGSVQINTSGAATIDPYFFGAMSSDDCGDVTITSDLLSVDCSNLGNNQVTITVIDDAGNLSSCTNIIRVEDPNGHCTSCCSSSDNLSDAVSSSFNSYTLVCDDDNGISFEQSDLYDCQNISKIIWGDGAVDIISNNQIPIHNYQSNGVFLISVEVVSIDGSGDICQTDVADVSLVYKNCDLGTGTKDLDTANLLIYPIPTHNILNIELSQNVAGYSTTIFNTIGEEIEIFSTNKGQLKIAYDASKLIDGVYFISLKDTNGSSLYAKFIKG